MDDYSLQARDSMKRLTERIIKSDLAFKKRRMIHTKVLGFLSVIAALPCVYGFYSLFQFKGNLFSLNTEAGDATKLFARYASVQQLPWRQIFRPEIYHQENMEMLQKQAEVTSKTVSADSNIAFKPYVWH